jgi:HAD superfamily hydrolase (TIGR01509 family)
VITTVIFDVGETLVDETRAWTAKAHAADLTPFTLLGALGALIEREEDHRRVWELLGVAEPGITPAIEPVDLYPDATPTIHELSRQGYRLGLAANQPGGAAQMLDALDLPLDFIATSTQWGVAKPAPEFFTRLVQESGAPPGEIAYVGDRLDNDVLPARAAGLRTVFLRRGPWGHLHARRPDVALAHARIESLGELPALLPRL